MFPLNGGRGENQRDWSTSINRAFLATELARSRSVADIAREVGCSQNTLRDQLVRHGLLSTKGIPPTFAADFELLGTIGGVAGLHKVSVSTARRWLLGLGIEMKEAHRPESVVFDVAAAAKRYEDGASLAAIAADLSVAVNTLKRRLEAHGVAMRSRGPRPGA